MIVTAGSLEITFAREGERRSSATAVRDDGVTVRIPGAGPITPLPHDLAHCVVERELHLERGFWASVAAGAMFQGMTVVVGRRQPHASERSSAIIKANAIFIGQAEVLVSIFIQIIREGLDRDPRSALRLVIEAQSACPAGILSPDVDDLTRICASLRTTAARWQSVSIDQTLVEQWGKPHYNLGHFEHSPRTAVGHLRATSLLDYASPR
jgi:hypothetical protein